MAETKSLAILGRQPTLGLAELESLYGAKNIVRVGDHTALLNLTTDKIAFRRLGGSTRLAKIIAEIPSNSWNDIEEQLANCVLEISRNLPEGKIKLGLSAFDVKISPAKLSATGLSLKKILRGKAGRSVRLVPNPELELNTAQVLHNNLTGPTGIELLVVSSGGQTIIGQTVAVQDIASYRKRDQERPMRDAKVGMLPPKLAQIIINLAANGKRLADLHLLDPFCGTGVILQEAGLMGGPTVYGSDLDERMVRYSRDNINWIQEMAHVSFEWKLGEGDATSYKWDPIFNVIASETYLGRPFTSQPDREILAKTVSECNLIIKKFLQNIHGQLESGTRLCLAVPAWQIKPDEFRHLPLVDSLEELGYNRVVLKHVRSDRLLYYREDQIVARELLVLTRK